MWTCLLCLPVCILILLSRLAMTPCDSNCTHVACFVCVQLQVSWCWCRLYFLTNQEVFLWSEDNSWRWNTICGVSKATMSAEIAALYFKGCKHVENGWEQDQIKVDSMLMSLCVRMLWEQLVDNMTRRLRDKYHRKQINITYSLFSLGQELS